MLPARDELRFLDPAALGAASAPAVLDVRTAEAFADGHLPAAVNLCVYEVAFAEKVRERHPDPDTPLVLCGQAGTFKAAEAAFARLTEAGYTDLRILAGGLAGWAEAGGEVVREAPPPEPGPFSASERTLALDAARSSVRWTGRNLVNHHAGTVGLAEGSLTLDAAGRPVRGRVVADMREIACTDLKEAGLAAQLVAHLASADFFLVGRHPTAEIELVPFRPIGGATPGTPDHTASGTITVRGVTCPIELAAQVADAGGATVLQAAFDLDRTRHGAIYGSGRLFERLGMHLVNDHVRIEARTFFGGA